MIFYLPERIYNLVKDTDEFTLIQGKMEESFKSVSTLIDGMAWIEKISANKYLSFVLDEVELMIEKYIPENMQIETMVCVNTSYNKEKLLALYNDYTQDEETRLFILSNIINWSYDDRTYPVFQNIYKNYYESIEWDKLKEMSSYVHLKYITASTETLCRKIKDKSTPEYLNTIKEYLDSCRAKYKDIVDKDILDYEYLEVFAHCITLMTDEMSSDYAAYTALNSTSIDEDLFNIQYGDYSIAKVSILNTKFELAFACRDFNAACRYLDLLIKYTNLGMSDMQKLLRGLMIYDKSMIEMYAASVRRILKLLHNINADETLSNIKAIDKDFALSDEETISNFYKVNTDQGVLSFQKTLKHYDDWLENNAATLKIFYDFYNNEYQDIKNSPDFDLNGILQATVTEMIDGEMKTETFDVYPLAHFTNTEDDTSDESTQDGENTNV